MTYRDAVELAKRRALRRLGEHWYVVEDAPLGDAPDWEVMSDAEYQAFGNEERCEAVVWSYADGHYNALDQFIENGRLAVEVEEYAAR